MVTATTTAVGPLVRAAIIVTDLDESAAFYREVLGLEEIHFEGEITDPAVGELLGLDDARGARCVILKAGEPAIGMVGLFEILGEPPPPSNLVAGLRRGAACLVFNHADLDGLVRKLTRRGSKIVCLPTKLAIAPGRDSREMTFRDPDGVMINCIEREM